jgi:hypothetical protein
MKSNNFVGLFKTSTFFTLNGLFRPTRFSPLMLLACDRAPFIPVAEHFPVNFPAAKDENSFSWRTFLLSPFNRPTQAHDNGGKVLRPTHSYDITVNTCESSWWTYDN